MRIDLIGERFGRLLVVEKGSGVSATGGTTWCCVCDCGERKEAKSSLLVSGHTKSCGCLLSESPPNKQDLSGRRFGRLLVKTEVASKRQWNSAWLCRCDCGNETTVAAGHLRSGHTQSCGCLHREFTVRWANDPDRQKKTADTQRGVPQPGGRHHQFNDRLMDTWTRESAYFLGWVVSDGHTNNHSVHFTLKDLEACEMLRSILDHPVPPVWRAKVGHWRVVFNSVHLGNRLLELGIRSPKSLTVPMPPVPESFMSHFVRGVFDGDGTAGLYPKLPPPERRQQFSMGIAGASERLIAALAEAIPVRPRSYKVARLHLAPMYRICWSDSYARDFRDWLYKDSDDLRLTRKYAICCSAPETKRRRRIQDAISSSM